MMKLGALIYDNGPGKSITSTYYAMERAATFGCWNYVKMCRCYEYKKFSN